MLLTSTARLLLNKLYEALQGDSVGLSPGYTLGKAEAKGLEISKVNFINSLLMTQWQSRSYLGLLAITGILAYKQDLEGNSVISSPVSHEFLSPENEAFSLSH